MAEANGRILNVDDYEPGRYARTQVLRRAGFHVTEVTTGAEALRIVAAEHFDVVLLDVNLPDIDGFEVCRRLREQLDTVTLPVVHISATFVNERAHQLARAGGAVGNKGYEAALTVLEMADLLQRIRGERSSGED